MAKKENLTLMIAAVIVILISTTSAWADLTDGLVAHWKLDEGAGDIAYDSAGDNDGTVVGDPCWTSGRIDGALLFDGDGDYVSLSENAVTTTEFTVAAWANHYGPGGGANSRNEIFCQRNDAMGNNHCAVELLTEGSFDNVAAAIRSSSGSIQTLRYAKKDYNGWHHYAMTVDSYDFILYIDGIEVEKTSNNQAGDYVTSIDYVNIGRQRYTGVNNGFFNGTIDDIRIYDRALSAEEIEELYRGSLIGLEIEGPEKIAEDSQTQYKAIISYERTNVDVTGLADWSVEPNDIAEIDSNGLLTTAMVDLPMDVTIAAKYSEDDVNESAEKQVSILAICPSGNALEFDGVDDYVAGSSSPFDFENTTFTVCAWVKKQSTQPGRIIVSEGGCFGGWILNVGDMGGFKVLLKRATSGDAYSANTTNIYNAGTWHHVAGVITTSTSDYLQNHADIYVDGTPVSITEVKSYPYAAASNNWMIGARPIAAPFHFDGLIDEVAIFDRALTAEEIWENMHKKLTGSEPNLAAYWDFDEGQGQIAYDMSVNGNNGYLGSDPCDIDSSDPNWTDSIPPVGICSVEGIVERNLSEVLNNKLNILEQLYETMAKEEALWEYMDMVFKDRDFGNTSKGDVVKAKQKINSAIQNEKQAEAAVDKSIDKLEDALDTLGIELSNEGQSPQ